MTFTLPNFLSLLRMGMIPLFIIAVLDGDSRKAFVLFVIAGLTDALDGFIARFWNQQSLLGAYLDPIADKLLLTSAYVVLTFPNISHIAQIPVWVTVLVIARDVLMIAVALVLYLAVGMRRFPPTVVGKVTTAFQVTAVVLVLATPLVPRMVFVAHWALIAVAVLTVVSGLDYVYRTAHLPPQAASSVDRAERS